VPILHVDDELAIREVVRRVLEMSGVTVVSADGVRAAKVIVTGHHDVSGAFLDVQLEDGNGVELCEWIREHRPSLARRVAFVTSSSDPVMLEHLASLGCPVLRKPFEVADLRRLAAVWERAINGAFS
jgi:CheY-like chemotaxis protein